MDALHRVLFLLSGNISTTPRAKKYLNILNTKEFVLIWLCSAEGKTGNIWTKIIFPAIMCHGYIFHSVEKMIILSGYYLRTAQIVGTN